MVDLGPVLTAATDYGDAREAEGRAAAEVEAAERIAELNAAMLVLKAEHDEVRADLLNQIAAFSEAYDETTDSLLALRAEYDAHMATHAPEPEPEPIAPKVRIGLRSPDSLWADRLANVGKTGVTSRRIYVQLAVPGTWDKANIVQQAIADGMLPVVSFKFPSISTAGNGGYDTWVTNYCTWLNSLGTEILVASWHEMSDDMTAAQYLAFARRHTQIINGFDNLRSFSINHGWLLDRRIDEFAPYMPDDMLAMTDYPGIDTYQNGTETSPGDTGPADRIHAFRAFLDERGFTDKQIVCGEFNTYTEAEMRAAGEAILDPANKVYTALVFDSGAGGKGLQLSGGRLEAYKAMKSDPRAKQ